MPVGSYAPVSFVGNGVTTVFPYNFRILSASHIKLTIDGALVTSGFSVSGVGNPSGGNITFVAAPAAAAAGLIQRSVPYVRTTDYQPNGDLREETIDADFDSQEMQLQQLATTVSRAALLPEGSALAGMTFPIPGAGQALRWNALGTALETFTYDILGTTFTQSGIGGVARSWTSKIGSELFNVDDFGAVGDDTTNDIVAIQKAFTAAAAVQAQEQVADGRVGAGAFSLPIVRFTAGKKYKISDNIVYGVAVMVEGNGAFLRQTDAVKDHFYCGGAASSNGYRVHIEGMKFLGGRSAFRLTGANVDTRHLVFERCEFHTQNITSYALDITCTTAQLTIRDVRVLDSPLFLKFDGDKAEILGGWINGYLHSTGYKPNSTDSIQMNGRELLVRGGVWVPESGASPSTATRWITQAIGSFVDIEGTLIGSEGSGGIPIVYSYGSADTNAYPFYTPSGVRIANSLLGVGNAIRTDKGAVVLVNSVPGKLVFENSHAAVEAPLVSDAIFAANYGGPVSDWLVAKSSANGPKIGVSLRNNNTYNVTLATLLPTALIPFVEAFIPFGATAASEFYASLGSPLIGYLPSINDDKSRHELNIRGQKRPVTSGTAFDILTFSKSANVGNSSAGLMGELLVMYVVEQSGGPVQAVATKRYDVAMVAGRGTTIAVTITARGNNDVPAAALGDIIAVTLKAGTTATAATLVCTITSGETGGCATWTFRQIGCTNDVASATGHVIKAASA